MLRFSGTGRVALAAIAAASVLAAWASWPVDRAGAAMQPTVKLVRVGFPAYDGTLTPYTFTLGYPLVTLIYDTAGQPRSATGAGGATFAPPGGPSSGSSINVVNVLSIVALAVVVVLAATALRRRRPTGRR